MRDSSALHLRRATIVNHPEIIEKREAETRKNRLVTLHKMEDENAKHDVKVEANRDAVSKLLSIAEKEGYLEQGACISDVALLIFLAN